MFHPLPLFLGLRYVRTRRRGFFVSFISWVSMLGVCLGVATLITIISVMNGFEGELRGRLTSLTAHANVTATGAGNLRDWPGLVERIQAQPGVVGAAPYVDLQGMLGRSGTLRPVLLHGVDPAAEPRVSQIDRFLLAGRLDELVPGSRRVLLGRVLAWQLGIELGDEVTVLVPGRDLLESGGRPSLQTFTVAGVFEAGLQDVDGSLVVLNLRDAADLAGRDAEPSGLRLRFTEALAAPRLAAAVGTQLGAGYAVADWTQEHAAYFRAIRIEKTMMSLILMLVVAVAAFNIVGALVMVVNEKRTEIAILRTLGFERGGVVATFLAQGLLIGTIGVALGVLLGVLLAANVGVVVPFLERTFGFYVMDPSVYYISELPSEVRAAQVAWIAGLAFLLTTIATVYPALRAAETSPADALRYE